MFDEAGGEDASPLPAGRYDFAVQTAQKKTTQNGKTMFVIKAVVESGPQARKAVWNNFVVSPESVDSMGVFFRQMSALGLGRDFFRANPSDDQIVDRLKLARFAAEVGHETWQGVERPKFTRMYPAGPGTAGAVLPPPPVTAQAPAQTLPPPPPVAAVQAPPVQAQVQAPAAPAAVHSDPANPPVAPQTAPPVPAEAAVIPPPPPPTTPF
jgi:hypothetical protein